MVRGLILTVFNEMCRTCQKEGPTFAPGHHVLSETFNNAIGKRVFVVKLESFISSSEARPF